MPKRFISIWFPFLKTDWLSIRHPSLKEIPCALAIADHGRKMISGINPLCEKEGVYAGMLAADAKAILPNMVIKDDILGLERQILEEIGRWLIRFTPVAAVDLPDGLNLEVTGCTYLWHGEQNYINEIILKLQMRGYLVKAAMANTVGAAWAISRFSKKPVTIHLESSDELLPSLPPSALRLNSLVLERMQKLGFIQIKKLLELPRMAIRRRFGSNTLVRIDQLLGYEEETLNPLIIPEPYQEWLPCLEPIVTPKGIELAIQQLLNVLCIRLQKEGKGIRSASLQCFRMDRRHQSIGINTIRPSSTANHLFKLFELQINSIEPGLGIEAFLLKALKMEENLPVQTSMIDGPGIVQDIAVMQLLDRLAGRLGTSTIRRYLPAEHHWPERSFRITAQIQEKPTTAWRTDRPRPLRLLSKPEPVEVSAPIPDYPPMLFRHNGVLHKIIKADGPERIEPEWWLQEGLYRDYYVVEDEYGQRFWIFRRGAYESQKAGQWFLHGLFA